MQIKKLLPTLSSLLLLKCLFIKVCLYMPKKIEVNSESARLKPGSKPSNYVLKLSS